LSTGLYIYAILYMEYRIAYLCNPLTSALKHDRFV
jgi:hypothetical protein